MKKIVILFLVMFSSFCSACFDKESDKNQDEINLNEVGHVFYTPFEIDFSAGQPESQFESLAFCKAKLKLSDFKKLIVATDKIYLMGNPRAKIIYKNNVYFISQEGIVTNFKETFKLKSIKEFEQKIRKDLQPNSNGSNQNFDSCAK